MTSDSSETRGTDLEATPSDVVVREELLRRIGRQWRVGDRLPPIKEIARQLGAGQSSTQVAVRHLVRQGLLKSRQRQGTFVLRTPKDPVPESAMARRFDLTHRTIRTYTSSPDPDGLILQMIRGFTRTIEPTGAKIERDWVQQSAGSTIELDPTADALVLFNPYGGALNFRPHQHLTIISTAMRLALPTSGTFDLVGIDEHHGGMLAGKAMAAAGCRHVCFLGRILAPGIRRYDATSMVRLYGFEAAWGKPLADEHLLYTQTYNPISVGEMFHQFMRLTPRPDGVFVASDDLAIGFIAVASSHGLKAGRDYQIIGFDGQDRGRHMGDISLTTVSVPAEEMGARAAMLLMERFAQPDRPVHRLQLDCSLQQGTTTSISQEISP